MNFINMRYIGDLKDNRKKKDKEKDYLSIEINLGEPKLVSAQTAKKNAKDYIERNQKSKNSCVPSSCANAIWNTEDTIFADEPYYSMRQNKPELGCYWDDIADMFCKWAFERKDVKEVFTEEEANKFVVTQSLKDNSLNGRQASYIWLKSSSIIEIVSIINSGIAVPFSIFADKDEYSKEVPEIKYPKLTADKAYINHAICAIPNTAFKDKDSISFYVTDSAHFGGFSKRKITTDFYVNRKKNGLYFIDLGFETSPLDQFRGYTFDRDLTIDHTGQDVFQLQKILKALGYFPSEYNGKSIEPTGYFGGITRQAVKDFQKAYPTILQSVGLTQPTGYFGASSRKKLNELLK